MSESAAAGGDVAQVPELTGRQVELIKETWALVAQDLQGAGLVLFFKYVRHAGVKSYIDVLCLEVQGKGGDFQTWPQLSLSRSSFLLTTVQCWDVRRYRVCTHTYHNSEELLKE